jgi:hypothetical protein
MRKEVSLRHGAGGRRSAVSYNGVKAIHLAAAKSVRKNSEEKVWEDVSKSNLARNDLAYSLVVEYGYLSSFIGLFSQIRAVVESTVQYPRALEKFEHLISRDWSFGA